MRLPVIRAFAETYGFVFRNAVHLLRLTWLPLLIATVVPFGAAFVIANFVLGTTGDDFGAFKVVGLVLVSIAAVVACLPMIVSGVLAYVLSSERDGGFFRIALGRTEARILLTMLIAAIWMLAPYLAGVVVVAIVAGLLPSQAAIVIVAAGGFTVFAAMIGVAVRLSLANATTLTDQRAGVMQSWHLSRGSGLRLFAFWVLVLAPVALIAIALLGLVTPEFAQLTSDLVTRPEQVASTLARARALNQSLGETLAATYLVGLIAFPLAITGIGMAYRMLSEPDAPSD